MLTFSFWFRTLAQGFIREKGFDCANFEVRGFAIAKFVYFCDTHVSA